MQGHFQGRAAALADWWTPKECVGATSAPSPLLSGFLSKTQAQASLGNSGATNPCEEVGEGLLWPRQITHWKLPYIPFTSTQGH